MNGAVGGRRTGGHAVGYRTSTMQGIAKLEGYATDLPAGAILSGRGSG